MRSRLVAAAGVLVIVSLAAMQPAIAGSSSSGTSRSIKGTVSNDPYVIDFAAEVAEAKPNGYRTLENPLVAFSDTVGAEMDVDDIAVEADGMAIRVSTDFDGSKLAIDLNVPANSIRLLFGNDDPGYSNPGDRAVVKVFRGGTLVGSSSVVMNRDDVANQTISFAGARFTRATVFYDVDPTVGLIEVVDNIRIVHYCGITGSPASNKIDGTAGNNGICGLGGADLLRGKNGNDFVRGDSGWDILFGGDGDDLVLGGPDRDVVDVRDGVGGNDAAYGGTGEDICLVDSGDYAHASCEDVLTV